MLDHLQIVLITADAGRLETRIAGRCRGGAETVFLLLCRVLALPAGISCADGSRAVAVRPPPAPDARRLLASSDDTLDTVAAQVGFSSGFHLSLAFKKAYDESLSRWKQAMLRPPAAADRGGAKTRAGIARVTS